MEEFLKKEEEIEVRMKFNKNFLLKMFNFFSGAGIKKTNT